MESCASRRSPWAAISATRSTSRRASPATRQSSRNRTFLSRQGRWSRPSRQRMRHKANILIGTLALPFALLTAALAGCKVGPNYARPAVEQPLAFKSQPPATQPAPPIPSEWWRLYQDPQLDQLIAAANDSNQTLRQAVA